MSAIDPRRTWRLAEARLATEPDPTLQRNLRRLITHMKAEAYLDMDALMATVSPDAHYHFWGPDGADEKIGKAAVAAFYQSIADSGTHRLDVDISNLVVDKHCIITEGQASIAYPGSVLSAVRGLDVDPDTYYLYQAQMLVVWPLDENGLFIGEDSYTGGNGFDGIENRPIDRSAIVTTDDLGPVVYPQVA